MEKESKDLIERYVTACKKYEEEKSQDKLHGKGHKIGNLSTFNQCSTLQDKLLKAILKENGYEDVTPI